MKSPFGMTIEATMEYNVSSKSYLKISKSYFCKSRNEKYLGIELNCGVISKNLRLHYNPWIKFAVITRKVFSFSVQFFLRLAVMFSSTQIGK